MFLWKQKVQHALNRVNGGVSLFSELARNELLDVYRAKFTSERNSYGC